jgi:hypothetical protein
MGVAWSTNALVACSLRMGSQDSPRSHGPIVLRCPENGREAPMPNSLSYIFYFQILRALSLVPLRFGWSKSQIAGLRTEERGRIVSGLRMPDTAGTATAESKERGKKGREEREGKDSHKRSSSDDPKSPSSHDGIEGTIIWITWFTWFWMRTYRSVFWIRELQV